MIRSVLGPIDPDEMGLTDAHSHLWISDLGLNSTPKLVLDDQDLIIEELRIYKENGGGSQLDCQPGGAGRDGNKLRDMSRASGVKVIACTGFHLEDYYPPGMDLLSYSSDQAADYFLDEIRNGLVETRNAGDVVFPGFIKIAARENLKASHLNLMEGAVIASLETGYLIQMHTEKGQEVEAFLDFFSGLGLPPDRLVICHIDKRPDPGLHKELAQESYLLEYDTFFRPKYQPEKNLWPLLRKMRDAGLVGSIACATDMADSIQWSSYGGSPGLSGFAVEIKNRLKQEGFDNEMIEHLLGKNICGRLAPRSKENTI